MAEHLIINEDDFDYFNRLVNSAVRDGFEIISSSSHWDYERNKTFYYAMAVNNNTEVGEDEYDTEHVEPEPLLNTQNLKEDTRIKLSAIDYLLVYAAKGDITSYCTEHGDTEIKPEWDEDYNPLKSLGRVFNRCGFLAIAAFTSDNILLINDFLLSNQELSKLTFNLDNKKINYKVIHFTPDDFRMGYDLISYHEHLDLIQKIQKKRSNVNFLQWLFK